jgi:hypothetical protein
LPSPDLQALADAVGSIQAGMAPITIRSLVPNTYRETLGSAIVAIANGTSADIETVNSVSRNGGGTSSASNSAPVISGAPVSLPGQALIRRLVRFPERQAQVVQEITPTSSSV